MSFFMFFLLIVIAIFAISYWGYYKITRTNELQIFLSKKLSRPNKYLIDIEKFENTLPIITANNVSYKKISEISTFTINVKKLTIFPDYLNLKKGIHSFEFNNASMFLKSQKFLMDSPHIELFGKYNQNHITIASSTFNVFGGKIFLTGNIDCNQRPSPYCISADLIYIRLQDILEGTKNKGLYTGDVYGKLNLNSFAGKRSPIYGETSLSITNGTYYKPELIEKINSALHKIGLRNTLRGIAENIASSSFSLNGDFIIKDKSYETNNAELKTPWCFVKFSGVIGPKSALKGTFIIKIKDYSSFTIKVSGENKKNMNYVISNGDKARIASILAREIGKGTEKQIKKEGKNINLKFNNNINKIGKKFKSWFK